jgi:hypothetical protein
VSAEELIHAWAARRLTENGQETAAYEVIDVDFIHEKGFWYSEMTYDPSYDEAVVMTVHGARRIHLYEASIPELLKEILS